MLKTLFTTFRIEKNLKLKIYNLLDDIYSTDKNWKVLAEKLSINK